MNHRSFLDGVLGFAGTLCARGVVFFFRREPAPEDDGLGPWGGARELVSIVKTGRLSTSSGISTKTVQSADFSDTGVFNVFCDIMVRGSIPRIDHRYHFLGEVHTIALKHGKLTFLAN